MSAALGAGNVSLTVVAVIGPPHTLCSLAFEFVNRAGASPMDIAIAPASTRSNGIALFAQIDHSGEAAKIGMSMPPTKLLIWRR
jgi:hypothetical protein